MGARSCLAAVVSAACLLAAAAGSAALAAAPVSPAVEVILRPSQIGAGYRLYPPSSDCIGQCVTLDLCGFGFPSERLRTTRLQTVYVRTKSAIQVSNEVVTYSKGGALQALEEVAYAAAHCPKKAVRSTIRGGPTAQYRLTLLKDSKLLPDSLAFEIHETDRLGKRVSRSTLVAVYQIYGNVLSGVYSAAPQRIAPAKQAKFALHAAEASAANLKRFALPGSS